jgi:hypothetical protein
MASTKCGVATIRDGLGAIRKTPFEQKIAQTDKANSLENRLQG